LECPEESILCAPSSDDSICDLTVAVVGGGLAATSSLLRAGCDVEVFSAGTDCAEVGAGVRISPTIISESNSEQAKLCGKLPGDENHLRRKTHGFVGLARCRLLVSAIGRSRMSAQCLLLRVNRK
jgi:hypothetical protein